MNANMHHNNINKYRKKEELDSSKSSIIKDKFNKTEVSKDPYNFYCDYKNNILLNIKIVL